PPPHLQAPTPPVHGQPKRLPKQERKSPQDSGKSYFSRRQLSWKREDLPHREERNDRHRNPDDNQFRFHRRGRGGSRFRGHARSVSRGLRWKRDSTPVNQAPAGVVAGKRAAMSFHSPAMRSPITASSSAMGM